MKYASDKFSLFAAPATTVADDITTEDRKFNLDFFEEEMLLGLLLGIENTGVFVGGGTSS